MSNNIEISGLTPVNIFPKCPPHFPSNQICETDKFCIPMQKPSMECILQAKVHLSVSSHKIICTPVGKKLVIEGVKHIKIVYASNMCCQSVNSAHFNVPFCMFVLLKDMDCKVVDVFTAIEYIKVQRLNCRKLSVSTIIFACPKIKLRCNPCCCQECECDCECDCDCDCEGDCQCECDCDCESECECQCESEASFYGCSHQMQDFCKPSVPKHFNHKQVYCKPIGYNHVGQYQAGSGSVIQKSGCFDYNACQCHAHKGDCCLSAPFECQNNQYNCNEQNNSIYGFHKSCGRESNFCYDNNCFCPSDCPPFINVTTNIDVDYQPKNAKHVNCCVGNYHVCNYCLNKKNYMCY